MAKAPPARLAHFSLFGGHPGPPLTVTLAHPERATRACVELAKTLPRELTRCKRLMVLECDGAPLSTVPAWIAELGELRVVSFAMCDELKSVSPALLRLPRLERLDLADTKIASLEGLAEATSLRAVNLEATPLFKSKTKMKELLASSPGWKLDGTHLVCKRAVAPPPKGKAAILKALRSGQLDSTADLGQADLAGVTLEGVTLMMPKLRRANLAKSRWTQCDFGRADLTGANLEGAVFTECVFSGTMTSIRARGAVFRDCHFDVEMRGADLTGASFVGTGADSKIDLSRAKGEGLTMELWVTTPNATNRIDAERADLRGAKISIDLTPEDRGRLADPRQRKLTRYYEWFQAFDEAKTNSATRITYATLPGDKPDKASATSLVRSDGPHAESIGQICANDGPLNCIMIDAAAAAAGAWKGDRKPGANAAATDFDRAMQAADEGALELRVGAATGLVVEACETGRSDIWRIDGGFALLEYFTKSIKATDKEVKRALGGRVAQLPTQGKPVRIGKVAVRSGALALIAWHTPGSFTPAQLASVQTGKAKSLGERALVPLRNGVYQVFSDSLGDYEDDLGRYRSRLRVVRS